MLVRLAYLAVSNSFTALRFSPMGDRDKDIEIRALRHQISVLQQQLGTEKPRFEPADRALPAALLAPLPRDTLRRLRLLVHAPREFEYFYNEHRPHQGIANAQPLRPLPAPLGEPSHTSRRPKTRPTRRHPAQAQARRLTCVDEVLGKRNVGAVLFTVVAGVLRCELRWRSSSLLPSMGPNWATNALGYLTTHLLA